MQHVKRRTRTPELAHQISARSRQVLGERQTHNLRIENHGIGGVEGRRPHTGHARSVREQSALSRFGLYRVNLVLHLSPTRASMPSPYRSHRSSAVPLNADVVISREFVPRLESHTTQMAGA